MTMGIMLFASNTYGSSTFGTFRCSNVGGYAQRIQVKPGLLYVQHVHAIRQGRFPNRNGLLSATKKENVEKANLD